MLRLGLICDFVEENWPSMDLVAEMLWTHLQSPRWPNVRAELVRPSMIRRFGRLPLINRKRTAFNADRLLNRFWDYPRHLRNRLGEFDGFHICDHSYAHLVHELPAERTGVYCHDLDCFRCLVEPKAEPRPRWFRAMSRRILRGLQQAAVVFCSTRTTQRRILELGLVDPSRLVCAPYGISPPTASLLQTANSETTQAASGASDLPGSGLSSFLLHVGSCIPRKRIDVLLKVFAELKARFPELQLVQIGGEWTPDQQKQIRRLNITGSIYQQRGIDRQTLRGLYRQARLVLQPSEAEGFGLPVLEALASGAIVVASDIPVLREVGGDGAVYCPVADISNWALTIEEILRDPRVAPDQARRLAQAQRFSWDRHAETILQAYRPTRRAAA